MNEVFAPPAPTAFDTVTTALTAAAYLAVGLAALVRAPRDVRARTFLAVALLNLGPAAGSIVLWREGTQAVFTKPLVALLVITTLEGSLALFHFTQVFPARRPWIAKYFEYLAAGYLVTGIAAAALVIAAPGSINDFTVLFGAVAFAVGFPLFAMAGIVVPLAGLLSLYKSYKDARAAGLDADATATLWMVISQLAGGILAAVVLPLLHMIGVSPAWTTAASALFFAFGVLMPIAFAMAVWRYRLLDPGAAEAADVPRPPLVLDRANMTTPASVPEPDERRDP